MNAFTLWNPGDQILVWGINVLLQATLVAIISLAAAATLRRNPAARYWVLCAALLLFLSCPFIAAIMQVAGGSLIRLSMISESPSAESSDAVGESVAAATGAESPSLHVESTLRDLTDAAVGQIELSPGTTTKNGILPAKRFAQPVVPEASVSGAAPISTIADGFVQPVADVSAPPSRVWSAAKLVRIVIPPVLLVWIAGSLFLVVRLAISWWRLGRILQSAAPNADPSLARAFAQACRSLGITLRRQRDGHSIPELVLSNRVSGPLAAGLRRPRVVLPERVAASIDATQLRDILLHEVAHIARRDQVVVLIQNLAGAVYWFHPLARMLNRQLAQAREEVCDNYVLTATDAPSYSRTLLALAQFVQSSCPVPGAVGLLTSRWKLEQRVAGLLDEHRNRLTRLTTRGLVLVVAVSVVIGVAAAMGTMTLATPTAAVDGRADSTIDPSDSATAVSLEEVVPPSAKTPTVGVSQPAATHASIASKQIADNRIDRPVAATPHIVSGTITDINGNPVPDAFVAVIALKKQGSVKGVAESLAEAVTDADGRYIIDVHGASSATHDHPNVIARTEESAIAWKQVDLDAASLRVDLSLQPQQLIHVRLVDIEGQPAANLRLETQSIMSVANPGAPPNGVGMRDLTPRPRAAVPLLQSDDDGVVVVPNISAGYGVFLRVAGTEQFAPQEILLNTGMPEERGATDGTYRPLVKNLKPNETATLALAPAQLFEGVVLLGDSDQPAANARITIWSSQQLFAGSMISLEGKTDAEGRFRLNPLPGVRFGIIAYPPEGSAYQVRKLENLKWESGDASKNLELRLPAGILATGTVVDAETGKPLHGACVQYEPDDLHNDFITPDIVTGWQGIQQTDETGQFRITVLPGPGTLLVHAPNDGNYVLQQIGSQELRGRTGGTRIYAHAIRKINPAPNTDLNPMTLRLTAGRTVTAKLVDESGAPINSALVVSRLKISPTSPQWRGFSDEAVDGVAQISGLREGEEYPVSFLDPVRKLGASATISTNNPTPTIELKPCGSARVRFVDPEGKPLRSGLMLGLSFVATPGKSKYDFAAANAGELLADEDYSANIDQTNYQPAVTTDENGAITWPALIPGATYRFLSLNDGQPRIEKEFVAASGAEFDMGEIVLDLNE